MIEQIGYGILCGCFLYVFICLFWPWGESLRNHDSDVIRIDVWREAWEHGKQVTFMEPEPKPEMTHRDMERALASRQQAQADPSAYWLGPRDKATNIRGLYVPWRN